MIWNLLPPVDLLILYTLFSVSRWYTYRWRKMQLSGIRGTSDIPLIYVPLANFTLHAFVITFLISYALDVGIASTAVLMVISFPLDMIIGTSILAHGVRYNIEHLYYLLGSVSSWALLVCLVPYTTWFGLLS